MRSNLASRSVLASLRVTDSLALFNHQKQTYLPHRAMAINAGYDWQLEAMMHQVVATTTTTTSFYHSS